MRRIEALETKEPAKVNQINPPLIHNPGCSYCQAPNYVFEECPAFQTHQVPPEHMNAGLEAATQSLLADLQSRLKKSPKFLLGPEQFSQPNFPNNLHHPNHQANFPSQASSSSFQNSPMEKKLSKLEESMKAFMKSQTAFMQNQGQTLNNHHRPYLNWKFRRVN